ncbi:root phototropism protein 3-like [Neltuma alba]|uniref:root phototropism protein 3-like n=1 Tax=Neltuma alba TaxID=207710 RepID=UPI0010A55FCF|nr:root phototropism protein 3-like [Prosopis alba]
MFTETNKTSQPEQPMLAKSPSHFSSECWFEDACILDMDYFIKTLSGIKAKGVRADLIGSIIIHYASKWLPELSDGGNNNGVSDKPSLAQLQESPESATASWMKKRFFVETLVGVLPPERDSIPCNFLLRLLRTANMVGVELNYKSELEKRISWQLDQASLKEIMIPSFSHTCETLLDVELVIRLVKRFLGLDVDGGNKSGVALMKVAKLVDAYLAETAVDANLSLSEFVALAGALPPHSRATDDGLYRAIDTYLKAHPGVSKQERKGLCRLIDCRKLTPEASLHAAQNERLPVRAVIQVLFSEQTKLHQNRQVDWSGSFGGTRSPNGGGDLPARSFSKREMYAQQMEIRKLKEDVYRLQSQCSVMQVQMERMMMEKNKKGFFKWKKFGITGFGKSVNVVASSVDKIQEGIVEGEDEFEVRQTPLDMKTRSSVKPRTPHKWRKSMS